MIYEHVRRELLLRCAQENLARGVRMFSLIGVRELRYDAEIISELELYGGCHGIRQGESECDCGWSPDNPVIKFENHHPKISESN